MRTIENQFFQKLTLLLLLFTALIGGAYSQVVNIAVSPNPVSTSVVGGNTVMETLTISNSGNAPLEWSFGAITIANPVTFTKEDFTDWQLEANQDRISGGVWLTRQNSKNIFNAALESSWNSSQSPLGTEWSNKTTAESVNADYGTLDDANGSCGSCVNGNTYSMRIPSENRYFDIAFTSFTEGGGGGNGGGGGFSYVRTELPQWIIVSASSGMVAGGGSEDITVTIDASTLSDGVYHVNLPVTNNSGNNPSFVLPIEVTVTGGSPDISTSASVAFADLMVGGSASSSLTITNPGTSDLTISDIVSSDPAFTPSVTSLVVPAQGVGLIDITFAPTLVQAYAGTLTITSDAASSPTVVNLTGNGLAAPAIGTVQTSFSETLGFGGMSSATLTVNNTGAATLNWTAEVILQGSEVTLNKDANADWTLPENQDALTPTVTLTRADNRGLFNILQETVFDNINYTSPLGTQWSSKSTANSIPGDYENWADAHGYSPSSMIGTTYSMHATAENRYFDFNFTTWGSGGGGGGLFAYSRKEIPTWLTLSATSGATVAAGSTDITLDYNANVPGGTYVAEVVLTSDDPLQPVLRLPVTITTTGTPAINIPITSVDLGSSFIGEPTTTQVEIQNTGTDDLTISGITSDNALFAVSPSSAVISGMQSLFVDVTFTPTAEGAANGQLTVASDDGSNPSLTIDVMGTGLQFPNIAVTHNPFTVDKDAGVFNETITIENTQGANLDWSFGGNDAPSLAGALENLNTNSSAFVDEIPGSFVFNITVPIFINSGPYNTANYIGSELSTSMSYSENVIGDRSSHFGAGTNTFTRHLDGVFVLGTELNGINEFRISGSLNSPADATVDALVVETTKNGVTYQGFVKRVYNTGAVAAVHHMVIIQKDVTVSQTFDTDPTSDVHTITGLSNTKRLYHLSFARGDGKAYGENRLNKIINGFLDAIVGVPEFVTLSATSGSTGSGASEPISVTIDPADVTPGVSSISLLIESNDPDEPVVTVPFTFTGSPKAVLSATTHSFGLVNQGSPVTQEFTLQNTGISTLEVSSIVSDEAQFAVTPSSANLAAGEQVSLAVTYDPTVDGAANGVITLTTNDPANPTITINVDGSAQTPPAIVTTPTDFKIELFPGETFNGQITIENTQGLDLNWELGFEKPTSLEDVLSALNTNFTNITSTIPSRYDFTYDLENNGSYDFGIATGGMSMFANGNRLNTNISNGPINYSDNVITDGVLSNGTADFGTNGRYFTRHLPGLFVMAADLDADLSAFWFSISGTLGNDGSAIPSARTLLEVTHLGKTYEAQFQQIHSGNTPSVNHLVIVEKEGINSYGGSFTNSPTFEYFQVNDNGSGFSGSNRIYYLMYSTSDGSLIDNAEATAIIESFLQTVVTSTPGYMTLSSLSGTTSAGVTETVTMDIVANDVTFEQEIVNMIVSSNDPANPAITIPLDIEVRNLLERNPITDVVVNEGFGTQVIDISNVFEDADSDPLTYSPASGNENAVTVAESMANLTITETGTGTSTISILADDGNGNHAFSNFNFRVNAAPTVASAIGNQAYENAFGSADFDLLTVFADADGDVLSYSVMTDASGIVNATETGGVLTLTEQGPGTVNVTVTADDGFGGTVQEVFEVFVNKINQTITFNALADMNYGDSDFNLAASASSGLTVTYTSSDLSVASVSGGTVTIVGAGTTTITASQDGDAVYNAAADVQQVLNMNQVILTTTATDASKTYGDANPNFSITYSGFVNGEDVTALTTEPTASTTADATSSVGTYAITASGGVDDNYAFSYTNGTLTVNQATLTATADDQNKTYGDANPTLVISYVGFVNGDDATVLDTAPTATTTADATSSVGTYAITVSGGVDNNYAITHVDGTLTINQAALTATADNQIINEGEALPTLSISYGGFVNGEDASVVDVAPTASVSISDSSVPGTYDITVSGGSDNNYEFVYQSGSLTVNEVLGLLNKDEIKVYPNPVVDYLSISDQSVSSIEIFDLRGVKVLSNTVNGQVDLTGLDRGSYMIQLRDKNEKLILTGRIIKN